MIWYFVQLAQGHCDGSAVRTNERLQQLQPLWLGIAAASPSLNQELGLHFSPSSEHGSWGEGGVRVKGCVCVGGSWAYTAINWVASAVQSQTVPLPGRPLLHLHLPLKGGGKVHLLSGALFLGFP